MKKNNHIIIYLVLLIVLGNLIFFSLKNKIKANENYYWTFENINENELEKLDLGIKLIPKNDKLIISFNHHGSLPSNAKIKLDITDIFRSGENLNLYYINEEENKIEFIDSNIEVKDGYVEFEIEHCSKYLLTASIIQETINSPQNINFIIVLMAVVILILITSMLFNKNNK